MISILKESTMIRRLWNELSSRRGMHRRREVLTIIICIKYCVIYQSEDDFFSFQPVCLLLLSLKKPLKREICCRMREKCVYTELWRLG